MLWVVGQNPAVSSPNLRLVFDALGSLDMLVVQEIWETETAAFWKRPGVDPKIDQDRGAAPAGGILHGEAGIDRELRRDGAVALQDRQRAGPGQDRRRDGRLWSSAGCAIWWPARPSRETSSSRRPSGSMGPRRICSARSTGARVTTCPARTSRPATSCAGWPISRRTARPRPARGSTPACSAAGENLTKRRDSRHDPSGSWACIRISPGPGRTICGSSITGRPAMRRGSPIPGSKPLVWWDKAAGRWTGHDVPDVPVLTDGPGTPNGRRAFH